MPARSSPEGPRIVVVDEREVSTAVNLIAIYRPLQYAATPLELDRCLHLPSRHVQEIRNHGNPQPTLSSGACVRRPDADGHGQHGDRGASFRQPPGAQAELD